MSARRIFTAAAIAVATAACSGGSPTLANDPGIGDGPTVDPGVPPTDTTGFVPPTMAP